jgi:catechol 2,3-dioxygenase-like lactoylglutathione lyase family enzyme
MSASLTGAHAVPKLPAQDLDRARAFYREKLGLEPAEEREGGLRYVCGPTEFHVFLSTGAASGESTQMGFEVEDLDATLADLRGRGVAFEVFDIQGFTWDGDVLTVTSNYPSKGPGERGAFFRDSEGNLLAIGQPTR